MNVRVLAGWASLLVVPIVGGVIYHDSIQSETANAVVSAMPQNTDGKLRIVAFGAHPDDAEIKAGGVGALWAEQGHHVKFVSVTNGDIGHWQMAGGALAQRRAAEVSKADALLKVKSVILDIHDGELLPTLENRKLITQEIRTWNADIVLAHRPNDYHPDHRYTGILVQDAAYMVTVPFFCPDTPHLTKNPVFLYYSDRFELPNEFEPDIVVSIDSVIERKLDALGGMESQFFEGGANGNSSLIPKTAEGREKRHRTVRNRFENRFRATAKRFREKLVELYGPAGEKVEYAEAFQVCEYGSQPNLDQLKTMFPLGTE